MRSAKNSRNRYQEDGEGSHSRHRNDLETREMSLDALVDSSIIRYRENERRSRERSVGNQIKREPYEMIPSSPINYDVFHRKQ